MPPKRSHGDPDGLRSALESLNAVAEFSANSSVNDSRAFVEYGL